jgi:hypothetical protein
VYGEFAETPTGSGTISSMAARRNGLAARLDDGGGGRLRAAADRGALAQRTKSIP